MRKMHPLTEEQKIFAEEHHNFIYQYLNGRKLDVEEYYDIAIFGYLQAVQEYLEHPALQEYPFTSIARTAMRDAISKEWLSQNRQKRSGHTSEFQEESVSLDQFLPDRQSHIAEAMDNQNRLLVLLHYLTPTERQVVHLQADGYTYREIAERCQITVRGVNSRFYRIRKKMKGFRTECL